jgi:SAM-dependent methyltransferase
MPMAIRAERFLAAALKNLESLKGTYLYPQVVRDLREKTGQVDGGYGGWLVALIPWLARNRRVDRPPRVLDFGCGTGELAVLMNDLGFEASGLDMHVKHLGLARILAEENGIPPERFVLHVSGALPFPDDAFDVVMMNSVVEHMDDRVLDSVLPELRRVCAGSLFILIPNRWKTHDDHTGLAFATVLPRWLAVPYVRAHGAFRRYGISRDGSWDVHSRTFYAVRSRLRRHGFRVGFVPDELVFPPVDVALPLDRIGGSGGAKALLGLPVRALVRSLVRAGIPHHVFYPYLNLVAERDAARERP